MFESVKNDKIVADLRKLADTISDLNRHAAEANSSTVGRFTTQLRDELSKVSGHVRDMVSAAIRHDEIASPPPGQEDV